MITEEFNRRNNRPQLNDEQQDRPTPYQARTDELKGSQYFWNKDRIIKLNIFRMIWIIFISLIISLIIWSVYVQPTTYNLIPSLISLGVFLGLLIFAQPQVYNRILGSFSRFKDSIIVNVDLMKNIRTFFYKDVDTGELHEDVLFIENNGIIAAFGMFKLDTVPISIHGEFNHLVRMIYGQKIPIFWNYVQAPITEKKVSHIKNVSLDMRRRLELMDDNERNNYLLNKEGIWEARIVFGTSDSKRIRTNATDAIISCYNTLGQNLQKIESAFLVNFPHSKIVALAGKDLLSAVYAQLTNGGVFRFF
ncbi:MAG: hypothetical protein ACFFDN_45635 [Candidatus Hodarchaeota archaeon]